MSDYEAQKVAQLVPTKTDKEMAEVLRTTIRVSLEAVCKIMDEALASNLVINFNLSLGPTGKNIITNLTIAKHF